MNDVPATVSLEAAAAHVWPVVIVGAGPAGAFLARSLARLGTGVLLMDRSTFPRWKVCGCCLNEAALSLLESSGLGGLTHACGAVPLTTIHLNARSGSVALALRGGAALSREAFDVALIRSAIAEGAAFLPGTSGRLTPVEKSDYRSLRARTRDREETIRARIVVAADGLGGQFLAGETGHQIHAASTAWIGAGTTVESTSDVYRSGTIYMVCGEGGYVGLVRLEDGRLDVAAAFDPAHVRRVGGLAKAAAHILAESGKFVPFSELDSPWRGTPLLTRWINRPGGERYFLTGDAAGYVEPFTGEGMAWALASSHALAPLILQALRDWDASLVAEWRRRHRALLGRRREVCWLITRILRHSMLTSGLVYLLKAIPPLARPFLAGLNRPFPFPFHSVRGEKRVDR